MAIRVLIVTLCFAQFANAAPPRSPTNPLNSMVLQQFNHRIQAVVSSHDKQMKHNVLRELISAQTTELSWPAFPRIWLERSNTQYIEANTSTGFKVPLINTGTKLSLSYRYELKSSLVIVSTVRREAQSTDFRSGEEELLLQSSDEQTYDSQIVRLDETTYTTYPDVRPGRPMVAFCTFEATLVIDRSGQTQFDVFNNGAGAGSGTVETASQTFFSNFIQVQGDIPISKYLDVICGEVFKEGVQDYVLSDFSKIVIEKVMHNHPDSECSPAADSHTYSASLGDSSCFSWHESSVDKITRDQTVPRCQLQYDGSHRCELRAKEGQLCPMYHSSRKNLFSSQPKKGFYPVTSRYFEHTCDTSQGLTCGFDQNPLFIGSMFFWYGVATCKKTQTR